MSSTKGAIPKRTRAQVGSTNRKRVDENEPKSPQPQRSSPKPSYSPSFGEDRQSTVMADTVSSLGKHHVNSGRTTKSIKDDTKQNTGTPLSNLELMQCKFVESFEEGTTNKIRLGDTHNNHSVEIAPTRFSSAPIPQNTSHLTYGEQGSPAFLPEKQRLATTYHTTIHAFPEPPGDPIRRDRAPVIVDENVQQKAISKEREAGRLARIRDNNARVEASNDAFQNKLITDTSRRVATVRKQQENYAQAVAERKARIGE